MTAVITPVSPEIKDMANVFFKLLRENGPLDLTQIIVETLISEDEILDVRDYLLTQGAIEERPDKGREQVEDPLLKVYGLRTISTSYLKSLLT